jgi:hypothetical protein
MQSPNIHRHIANLLEELVLFSERVGEKHAKHTIHGRPFLNVRRRTNEGRDGFNGILVHPRATGDGPRSSGKHGR